MIRIDATPKSVFSLGYELCLADAQPVTMDVSWGLGQATFEWEGVHYNLYREAPCIGSFVISDGSDVAVRAVKGSALMRAFAVRFRDRTFRLRAVHPFTRRFVLEEQGNAVGMICPHPFSRKCRAEFPDGLPVPVCVFLFWLAVSIGQHQTGAIADR